MNAKNRLAHASVVLGTVGLVVLAAASGCGPSPDAPTETPDAAVVSPDAGVSDATPDADPGRETGVLEAGACAAGTADCDGNPRNGCESKLDTDAKNCGACGHDCTGLPHVSGATTCSAGKCVVPATSCAAGFAHCSSNADDGCEADLSKQATCGSCSKSCSGATPVCSAGACSNGCGASAPTLCSGSCVDTTKSATNCGTCGNACPTPAHGQATCASSACGFACNSGYHACGGACADNASPLTCGTSCTPCSAPAHGYATCNGTTCDFACDAGYHRCGNACAADDDATACGASCTVCTVPSGAGHATCSSATCGVQCDTGNHLCNGTACSSNTSVATCGTSCTPCAAPPSNGHATCDGTSCGIACDAGTRLCSGNTCKANDVNACGASCSPCPTPANAVATCNGVACGFTCNAGFADCDGNPANGCEVNLTNDGNNCNACGHSCLGGACSASACQPVVLATAASLGPVAVRAGTVYYANGTNVTAVQTDRTPVGTFNTGATPLSISTGRGIGFVLITSNDGNVWSTYQALNNATLLSSGSQYPSSSTIVGADAYWGNATNTVNEVWTSNLFAPPASRSRVEQAPGRGVFHTPNLVALRSDDNGFVWSISDLSTSTLRFASADFQSVTSNNETGSISDIAIDNYYTWFISNGALWRTGRTGGNATVMVNATNIAHVVTDSSGVYYTSTDGGVHFAPQAFTSTNVIASGGTPTWIASGGTFIVWTDTSNNRVMLLAK